MPESANSNIDGKAHYTGPVDYGETFKVSYKMNLLPTEAAYSLFIDS